MNARVKLLFSQKYIPAWMIMLCGGIALSIVFQRHVYLPAGHWRCFIWADQAGYYVYLPALFIYNFEGKAVPDEVIEKSGNGFQADTVNNKIITQYTYGVALLQSPFFLLGHAVHTLLKGFGNGNGFGLAYIYALYLSGVFWGCLGLYCLWGFLRVQYGAKTALISVVFLWASTPLLYYHSENGAMSHIYSFAIFSYLLYAGQKLKTLNALKAFALGGICALAFLIRPTSALAIIWIGLYFWFGLRQREWIQLLRPKYWIWISLAVLIVLFPQLLYWKYLSGSWIYYSYKEQTFSNLLHPEIIKFWFSPKNGLFPYAPVWLLICLILIFDSLKRNWTSFSLLLLFVGSSYLFSSWFIWYFGCGFGSRNHVEYIAFAAIPFTHWLKKVQGKYNLWQKTFVYMLLCLFLLIPMKLFHGYRKCFFGQDDWDWKEYIYQLERKDIQFLPEIKSELINDRVIPLQTFKMNAKSNVSIRECIIEVEIEYPEVKEEDVFLIFQNNLQGEERFYSKIFIKNYSLGKQYFYYEFSLNKNPESFWFVSIYNPNRHPLKPGKFRITMR